MNTCMQLVRSTTQQQQDGQEESVQDAVGDLTVNEYLHANCEGDKHKNTTTATRTNELREITMMHSVEYLHAKLQKERQAQEHHMIMMDKMNQRCNFQRKKDKIERDLKADFCMQNSLTEASKMMLKESHSPGRARNEY